MDAILQAQFDRVETALGSLVESIATFNPSPQAALDLVAADDELSRGLEQLSRHQENYARILTLRSEADALEAQLRSSIGTLASLRNELLDTTATTVNEDARTVSAQDVLDYAILISRHTVPPTYREPIPKGPEDAEKDKDKDDVASSGAPTNAIGTPALPSASLTVDTEPAKEGTDMPESAPAAEEQPVTAMQAEWLKKLQEQGTEWVPWPSNDKIQSGNLMAIQRMLNQNKDPWVEKVPNPEEALAQELAAQEFAAQAPGQPEPAPPVQQPPREHVIDRPRPPQEAPRQFTGFDFDEDDD